MFKGLARPFWNTILSLGKNAMQYEPVTERWKALCEQAATEQDGERLLAIIQELNRVLNQRGSRIGDAEEPVLHSAA